jgi:vacuolar-type H+-ATPase subunit H
MAKQDTGTEIKRDEFSKIFEDYRAKIEEITRRSEINIHAINVKPAANQADEEERIEVVNAPPQPAEAPKTNIQSQLENVLLKVDAASDIEVVKNSVEKKAEITPPPGVEPPPSMVPPAKVEAVAALIEKEPPVLSESAETIERAKREAKKIIEEAEENAKKEAKKRTQSQVDKIIEKARKEAEEIVARANKSAEKVRDDVIAESKREADYIIREITQKYRQETEAKSSRIMSEAQEKAARMLSDISASTMQVGQHIAEIVSKAKQTAADMETSIQAEVTELTKVITETQQKLEESGKSVKEEKCVTPTPKQTEEMRTSPTLAIRLIGEKSSDKNGGSMLFSGQMEMKSESASFDYQYLKKLKKYLIHIPKIKYLQEYASEKEMSVVFDVLEPLPLLDILRNIPAVNEVVTRADDDICLIFKTTGD